MIVKIKKMLVNSKEGVEAEISVSVPLPTKVLFNRDTTKKYLFGYVDLGYTEEEKKDILDKLEEDLGEWLETTELSIFLESSTAVVNS